MEVSPNHPQPLEIKPAQSSAPGIQQIMDQLRTQKEIYAFLFSDMYAEAQELNAYSFVPLTIQLGQLETDAQSAREAIKGLALSIPLQAQEFKASYDQIFTDLFNTMTACITETLPKLQESLRQKLEDVKKLSMVSPAVWLDIQQATQQYELLMKESNEQIRRIQLLRLFEI